MLTLPAPWVMVSEWGKYHEFPDAYLCVFPSGYMFVTRSLQLHGVSRGFLHFGTATSDACAALQNLIPIRLAQTFKHVAVFDCTSEWLLFL